MSESQSLWQRSPVLRHAVRWWLFGAIWWVLLAISFGISDIPVARLHGWGAHVIRYVSLAIWAPVVALPWTLVGVLVGLAIMWSKSRTHPLWIPIAAFLGAAGAGIGVL